MFTGSNDNVSPNKSTGAVVHVANMGCTAAYICREGSPVQITKDHNVTDVAEKQRVISHGGAVSSSGQVQYRSVFKNLCPSRCVQESLSLSVPQDVFKNLCPSLFLPLSISILIR